VGRVAADAHAVANQVAAAYISPCSAGYYRDAAASTALTDCADIAAGKQGQTSSSGSVYASSGATFEVDCVAGKYQLNGDAACADTPAGHVSRVANDADATANQVGGLYSVPCSAGYYRVAADVGTANDCADIAAGKQGQTSSSGSVYASTGAAFQVDCVAGKYSTDGDAACADVAAGKVGRTSNDATTGLADSEHEAGAAFEVGCFAGTYRTANNDASDCINVPAGKVGHSASASTTTPHETGADQWADCPAGTFRFF
jgi:hypothetical protein